MGCNHTHIHTAKLDSETKTARSLAGSRAIHTQTSMSERLSFSLPFYFTLCFLHQCLWGCYYF